MQKILRGLDKVRTPQNDISVKKKVLYSVLVLALGIVLGTVSKALDEAAVNELPAFLEYLDIGNFLGRFSIWIFQEITAFEKRTVWVRSKTTYPYGFFILSFTSLPQPNNSTAFVT